MAHSRPQALTLHTKCATTLVVVQAEAVTQQDLALINAYNPGISSAWMMQRAMSVRVGEQVAPNVINRMLSANFTAMHAKGKHVMRPFLQDVMQFGPFLSTVIGQMARDPLFIPELIRHVGWGAMLDWLGNFVQLGLHRVRYALSRRKVDDGASLSKRAYRRRRQVDAVRYGSGADFKL
jgi:lycopene cyclase CruP